MSQITQFTTEQIYSAFKECFEDVNLEDDHISSADRVEIIWPYFEQLFKSQTMKKDISNWKTTHKDAFMQAYHGHMPLDCEEIKAFSQMSKKQSFVMTIIFHLNH